MQKEEMKQAASRYGQETVTRILRKELAGLREMIGCGADEAEIKKECAELERKVLNALEACERRQFHRVLNATGTVLHTNLGRAPLSEKIAAELVGKIQGYSNLEYDLEEGCRGERYSHFEYMITELTGAEAAVAVNNNAAAVLLCLSALAYGKEVIVSRGELIEIGGKFRIPDVIKQGGAVLREVGTTNKTHPEDYARAITEETALILKVHTSNYRIHGFTEAVSVKELKKLPVPVIEDLGSGVLINTEIFGLSHEPTVQEALQAGADLVCFSGDKLLGGPQAGIIAGKRELIDKIKAHPLMRAVRIDKFTAAGLETVLQMYRNKKIANAKEALCAEIPVLQLLARSVMELTEQAETLKKMLKDHVPCSVQMEVRSSQTEVGGGTLPGEVLAGAALVITETDKLRPDRLAERLRKGKIPVICRISDDCLWFDMRTIFPEELTLLADALQALFGEETA